jgi:hypothetical protein
MAKSKKTKNKAKLNLTVRDEQRNKLAQMASLENRSVSNLIEVMADEPVFHREIAANVLNWSTLLSLFKRFSDFAKKLCVTCRYSFTKIWTDSSRPFLNKLRRAFEKHLLSPTALLRIFLSDPANRCTRTVPNKLHSARSTDLAERGDIKPFLQGAWLRKFFSRRTPALPFHAVPSWVGTLGKQKRDRVRVTAGWSKIYTMGKGKFWRVLSKGCGRI